MNTACSVGCLSSVHFLHFSFSILILILLMIWKSRMTSFDHTCFPALPGLSPYPVSPPPTHPPPKEKSTSSPIRVFYIFIDWHISETLSHQSFKGNTLPYHLTPTPDAINCEELCFCTPIMFVRSSHQPYCLGCFFWEQELSPKPSVSLILNCESALTDTTAKEASSPIIQCRITCLTERCHP